MSLTLSSIGAMMKIFKAVGDVIAEGEKWGTRRIAFSAYLS